MSVVCAFKLLKKDCASASPVALFMLALPDCSGNRKAYRCEMLASMQNTLVGYSRS